MGTPNHTDGPNHIERKAAFVTDPHFSKCCVPHLPFGTSTDNGIKRSAQKEKRSKDVGSNVDPMSLRRAAASSDRSSPKKARFTKPVWTAGRASATIRKVPPTRQNTVRRAPPLSGQTGVPSHPIAYPGQAGNQKEEQEAEPNQLTLF